MILEIFNTKRLRSMRFFEGINALDYPPKGSATLQEGGTTLLIRRVEFIPGRLIPSRAYFRLTQQGKFQNKKLHLQRVEKTNHLLVRCEMPGQLAVKQGSQLVVKWGGQLVVKYTEKQELLIIDDFGMQPLDSQSRTILMEIIEDRHGKRSTLFTSQVPVNNWYEVIGEQTIADAILDCIIHDAHRLELKGDSMRKRKENLKTENPEKDN